MPLLYQVRRARWDNRDSTNLIRHWINDGGTPWNSDAMGVYLFQLRHKFKETKKLEWPETLCMYGLRHWLSG